MNGFDAPKIEYFTVSPILIILGVAVIGVLIEAIVPRGRRYVLQVLLALAGLIAAIVTTVMVFLDLNPGSDTPKTGDVVAMGALAVDGPALFCWLLVL
ncbi:MAG: NADH-quinone oxidoreductase subunit N, partial [Marmoricola sp.]